MKLEKIMVIGSGQMGNGIAQVCAQAGYDVYLNDMKQEFAEKGLANIVKNLTRDVEKGRKTEEEKQAVLDRITLSTDKKDAVNTQLVIEAAVENFEIKKAIFKELDEIVGEDVILSTNTSSLPITDLAAVVSKPERFIGMHFMNPVPVMKLVEIIRGVQTNDETYQAIHDLTLEMNKVPVEVNDSYGFVSNRVLMPMINEAAFTLYQSVATPEAIDQVMELGMNHPMGPLKLADFIGLDTCLSIMQVLYEGFNDPKYRPCPLLKKYVAAGYLGKKSGRGFYKYD
ncbi:3-hydroxybutyryl-CoA dehydrogenase [Vagococcus fluvialis]|jgi:3-hydroxybutyryl-CoA dehydrogenase|uniref:3-hydroxybutyryl-CoA dehydrogenase n=2 Tax=Bacteria TaxID=2 RepID=A0A369AZK8_9ENTE|nr:3-hydroxybutyryl-CoA dehydrogenase [Vagococcus fluvialis]MDR2276352.1 3-hydroxybutyryl-CoA dehydrogenase [Vagococcus sp.]MBO0429919.1 3-hydroxybutyryl-CoA dehydrogenase [Vagococcus fluvialis]MBO0442725.1 3-hydroxybutyryl-CoA dehydrogenase [Vagococcus fluvialis]MBO0478229.1 3-hydroxybutyryl-CoA dehydrogenase [Vagococcus fluvialis]MBO0483560.1 3-hydroxybutyryl-CoA dehydrogenase [Vagococcus fluvialis]